MSYKALYRTYRPNNFDEVVGQDHITSTLKNIISNNKLGHAYLFAGPRGTGKTSVAHVFARAMNVNAAGQEMFGDMDIIEIDAASNNGVAEVRVIIDNVNYAPTKAKYKVYIIDEVHMLTKGAFNALLKTLEEPPAHVVFILATTEPHKIPITILSRTQRFNFRRIDDVIIGKQLTNVLQKEGITFDEESIKFISKLAQGGMRDALSIADQASAFGNGRVSFEAISQVFGIISISNQIKLFNLAYKGNAKELMKLVTELLNNGADIERLTSSLLDILKDFIIIKKTSDHSLLSFVSTDEVEALQIDVNYAYDAVDILIKLISDLKFTSVPRQSFELAILKMAKNVNSGVQEKVSEEKPKTFTQEIKEEAELDILEDAKVEEIETDDISQVFEATQPVEVKHDLNFDIVQEEEEDMLEQAEVEDDILTTQEIELPNDVIEEISDEVVVEAPTPVVEDTAEIDIMKLFEPEPTLAQATPEKNGKHSVDEIINLLVQADRNEINSMKMQWEKSGEYQNDKRYKQYSNLISKTRIISAGSSFVLISSEQQYVVDGISAETNESNFVRFINELVGRPIRVFAISKEEFNIVKETWSQLATSNSLPQPKPVTPPVVQQEQKTEEEEFGFNLFGDLFSS